MALLGGDCRNLALDAAACIALHTWMEDFWILQLHLERGMGCAS
jgi:hypothetical protein